LFVISIIPLSLRLRKSKAGYEWTNKTNIKLLLFIDDFKLYAKEMKQLDSLVHTVKIFSKPWDREMCSTKKMCDNKVRSKN